jgi:steroid delta-isomerase-like uncharacterized protein
MATTDLERFFGYMQAFELAWLSDDWSGLTDLFAPGAIYEPIDAGAFGGGGTGRDAAIAALRASTSGIDRRFDVRLPEVLEGPLTRPDGTIFMRYSLTLRRAGVPDFVSYGDHVTTFASGRIARIVDTPDAGVAARLADYLEEHGAKLRPAGSALATSIDPRDARDLDAAMSRSLARAYGHAKSEQDIGAALAVCSPDFVLDTPSLGTTARGREEVTLQLGLFFEIFPDYRFAGEGCAAENGSIAFWGRVHMTFAKPFLGIPATGRKIDMPAVSIFTQQGGALGSETFFLDLATLAEQMGVGVDDMRARLAMLRPAEPLAQAAGGAR